MLSLHPTPHGTEQRVLCKRSEERVMEKAVVGTRKWEHLRRLRRGVQTRGKGPRCFSCTPSLHFQATPYKERKHARMLVGLRFYLLPFPVGLKQ